MSTKAIIIKVVYKFIMKTYLNKNRIVNMSINFLMIKYFHYPNESNNKQVYKSKYKTLKLHNNLMKPFI